MYIYICIYIYIRITFVCVYVLYLYIHVGLYEYMTFVLNLLYKKSLHVAVAGPRQLGAPRRNFRGFSR